MQELFAIKVFTRRVMEARLPAEVFSALQECTHTGGSINPDIAQTVADEIGRAHV